MTSYSVILSECEGLSLSLSVSSHRAACPPGWDIHLGWLMISSPKLSVSLRPPLHDTHSYAACQHHWHDADMCLIGFTSSMYWISRYGTAVKKPAFLCSLGLCFLIYSWLITDAYDRNFHPFILDTNLMKAILALFFTYIVGLLFTQTVCHNFKNRW